MMTIIIIVRAKNPFCHVLVSTMTMIVVNVKNINITVSDETRRIRWGILKIKTKIK